MSEAGLTRLKGAIAAFHREGRFNEEDYVALRAALAPVSPQADLQTIDGFVGLFFERHLMNDTRRSELLMMDEETLGRAVRHRFRQLMSDEHEGHRAYHALRAHVGEALAGLGSVPETGGVQFPPSIQGRAGFSPVAVEQAVAALWCELRRKPAPGEATSELLKRYLHEASAEQVSESREFPEVVRAHLDAQRLARGMLAVLSAQERDLLRQVLDGGSVDDWAAQNAMSRASAYRLHARLKSLCQLELRDRSHHTQLDAFDALRGQLR
jgi:hypothetical protein